MDHDAEQLNVLVIDDDDDVRRVLVGVVTSRGHQALPAASAEEGMALIVVTHSMDVARRMAQVYELTEGKLRGKAA